MALDGSGSAERVTPTTRYSGAGCHEYTFSPDAAWAFHTFSGFDTPPITELVRLPEHEVVRVLEGHEALRRNLSLLPQPPTTEFLVRTFGSVSI
eukprot:COSAG05_NODE_1477_length_4781_cov_6.449381_7_plen_94_part_00